MRALLPLAIAASIGLAGCNASGVVGAVNATNNALARTAGGYELPAACAIIRVADGYFQNVRTKVSANAIKREAQAMAVVNAICDNPPSDIVGAFGTLMTAWTNIQAATRVPGT